MTLLFFDRDIAKSKFNEIISVPHREWIAIIGDKGIGKSSFVKEVLRETPNLYICEPVYELKYWREFSNIIKKYSNKLLPEFLNANIDYKEEYIHDGFINDLNQNKLDQIIEEIVKTEIAHDKNTFAKHVGRFLSKELRYIVLDNIHLCSIEVYEWLVALTNSFSGDNNAVIVICDMDQDWESDSIKRVFQERYCEVNISSFDDSKAYYDLIRDKIYFNNERYLSNISADLYNAFHGDSRLILKLIDEISQMEGLDTDEQKKKAIYETCSNLLSSGLISLNSTEKSILALLAATPMCLSLDHISSILEHPKEYIKPSLDALINKNLIEVSYDIHTFASLYKTSDYFSKSTYTNLVKNNFLSYIYLRLFSLAKQGMIQMHPENIISIILEYSITGGSEYIYNFLTSPELSISREYKAILLNYLISNNWTHLDQWRNIDTLNLLYDFGYYESTKKFIGSFENIEENYLLLMKCGDLSHLTLDKNTSNIFKRASEIEHISTSEYLSAVNRQIMAMTQQDKQGLLEARVLYKHILDKYSKTACKGLVELYRNANNIFEYPKSLELTIKGFHLAKNLDEKLEMIKCLHNICMILLLNEKYDSSSDLPDLGFNPSFEYVYKELSNIESFRHEMAYPLLDMAALKMFKFSKCDEKNCLIEAKSLYSEAQLYAKSFYAKNIAEMGLLVVNSYLYSKDKAIKRYRTNLFDKYQKQLASINDFRVHRKILFSLATSALITGDYDEGAGYLRLSKKHVFEKEILRYNKLCDELNIGNEKIASDSIGDTTEYHGTIKFVPWLISFGH